MKMKIFHGWIVFFTIATATEVFGFHCPESQSCTCQPSHSGDYEVYCVAENESAFSVNIQQEKYIQITCRNKPQWSDFHLRGDFAGKRLQSILFRMCDLPTNSSLSEVVRQMGVESVESLVFQSFGNLSDQLTKSHFEGFETTKKLVLSSNGLSHVPKDLLQSFPQLNWLDFRENNLRLPLGIFDNTPQLEVLELGNNGIEQLEPGIFNKLKKLRLLNIWKNSLTEITSGIFDELQALESLDMSSNSLTTLPDNIFKNLKKLENLSLFGNDFISLPEGLLNENVMLKVVKLFNNKRNLTTLPNHFLANLTNLQTVRLSRNRLKTLPEDIFWGSSSLTNISLERNFLITLPRDIFKDLKHLKELQLGLNDIETLPDGIFSHASELVKLDLSRNCMVSISRYLFEGLKSLTELNMEYNRLKTIHGMALMSVTNLRIARFSHNQLMLNSSSYQDEYGTNSPFFTCTSLEELYLDYNNISQMYSDWIISNTHLRILDLKYNKLSFISTSDLQFVSNNIRVDFTHNNISNILLSGAEVLASLQQIQRNVIILMEYNPIQCDCYLYDFLRYLEGRMHPNVQNYFHIIPGNLTCKDPEWLQGVIVTELKSQSLKCTEDNVHPNTKCPKECTCWIRPEDRAYLIDCSYRNISEISNKLQTISGYRLELNFSGNSLTRMPSADMLESQNVTTLLLSHNNIAYIPLNSLTNNLEVLELHHNNMSQIDSEILNQMKNFTSLRKLTLHGNPWKCDCEAKELLNFVQLKLVDFPDLRGVKCKEMNVSMSEMTINDFCPVETAMIVGISFAVALMGLSIGGIAALYYRYQQEIKVWLYAHQCCLWFVTEDELDKDKLYDAFISYSHKDENFVVNELVSKLESGPRPYKLCLHFRDWLAGEWIPTQITRSVEDSKRTVVVVSPNFLESVWGRMEFRAAHRQALTEGRARVILILYGDIGPTDNLDSELKAYLNMNTYVKWGDPWFWDKLRYALPHPPELTKSRMGRKLFERHYPCIQINGEKKELIYPVGIPETLPAASTPPADTVKSFLPDGSEKNLNNQVGNGVKNKNTNLENCEAINKQILQKMQCTTV